MTRHPTSTDKTFKKSAKASRVTKASSSSKAAKPRQQVPQPSEHTSKQASPQHQHTGRHAKAPQAVRIIGGSLKRSRLPVVALPDLRPTPDRVRETLFNWIDHLWQGHYGDKSVLDFFAGTGALGFEAASRGAAHVRLVEKHPKAVAALRQFRTAHGLDQVRISDQDALAVMQRMDASRFDLIFIDPPFQHPELLQQLTVDLACICTPEALVYIESASPFETPESMASDFELLRRNNAGATHFCLYQHIS